LADLLFSANFAIVPIISGSGMRTKCIDYIIAGVPFIITERGIEGLTNLRNDKECLIFNNVDENFIRGINFLHENKELLQEMHTNLLKVSKMYSLKKFENRFYKLYLKLIVYK